MSASQGEHKPRPNCTLLPFSCRFVAMRRSAGAYAQDAFGDERQRAAPDRFEVPRGVVEPLQEARHARAPWKMLLQRVVQVDDVRARQ
jgi:hypothetical protein